MYFEDRLEAGRVLSQKLLQYCGRSDVTVLALPRGGVPVAYEVAKALDAPLDVFLVRKLGVPGHEELAMGAVADGRVIVRNEDVVASLAIPDELLAAVAERESHELVRQRQLYREREPATSVLGRTVILVDDGLATGATMRAAIAALRKQKPNKLIVAVPVGAVETCHELQNEADEVICAVTPPRFGAVGAWYSDFSPTSDETVRDLLRRAASHPAVHTSQ